ncbi:hypothetical protein [Vibrio spartinae]|uniref:Uncharacterized protein n=1 Tax=Vibrio spartinae TaxID=1918945 RepID=A0ABX6QYZ2_9VIBR|nr:hypothetical protein [Vibrio spartinae]QMV14130.1 hypothetical protein Vspart_01381 [Vibrio spartinae]
MYQQVEKKTKKGIGRSVTDSITQKQGHAGQGFKLIDNRAVQREINHQVNESRETSNSIVSNGLAQLKGNGKKSKSTQTTEPKARTFKFSGANTEVDVENRQDNVQAYLAEAARQNGSDAIADYIEENAATNGGLCAGWVVLHRQDPSALTAMWDDISKRVRDGDEKYQGRSLDKAINLYMKAHYHFAMDVDNRADYEAPKEEVFAPDDLPQDGCKKVKSVSKIPVKYGTIYDTAVSIMNQIKSSKKQVFVEIYSSSHTTQVEFKNSHLQSVCASEYGGVKAVTDSNKAEKLLSSDFFETPDSDETVTLSFDVYAPK